MAAQTPRLKGSRQWIVDDKPTKKASETWQVYCTDKNDGANVATAACKQLGDSFSADEPSLLVRSVDAQEGERTAAGGVFYLVKLDYSTESENPQGGGDPAASDPDPTKRPGILRLSFNQTEEQIYKQLDDKPVAEDNDGNAIVVPSQWIWGNQICNAAGDPFQDGIREVFKDAVITYTTKLRTENFALLWSFISEYVNTVNSDIFTIRYRGHDFRIRKETAWLYDATSEPGYENDVAYEDVQLTFVVRADGWRRKMLNQGFNAQTSDDVSRSKPAPPILDQHGDPILVPALLGIDGKKAQLDMNGKAKPVWLKFRTKGFAKFRGLSNFFDEIQ